MGLDTTHDCWHGPYSSFGEWRRHIASLVGINLSEMIGFGGEKPWEDLDNRPIFILLNHSDCDGIIEWKDTEDIANELEALLPKVEGDYFITKTNKFIKGLRLASYNKEDVEFH